MNVRKSTFISMRYILSQSPETALLVKSYKIRILIHFSKQRIIN